MSFGVEMVLPYGGDEKKGAQVRLMFDTIARRYDRLNHLMSIGFDKSWRRRGVDSLKSHAPMEILDIASGTGDLALLMQKRLHPRKVTGADLSEEMMNIGRHKVGREGVSGMVVFEHQDCMSLTYPDNSFDAVTVAFGIRNFEQLDKGLAEMYRVLRPGGHIMILELTVPRWFPMNVLYRIYTSTAIPLLSSVMGIDKKVYHYLPESIRMMPQGKEMTELLSRQGFKDASFRTFTGGVCTMYSAHRANG
ncbi:MAG: bifunctional demethylmenaquinone methyltransferase/2-methoxy-6-polyprenyl-1,4-benzoquinol methylase UbiE [Tannerella sp.]|jgi:demethylmenaquinone methyltransferase/2-methoxy-6-polyprenyl-1,4-benzoquinol methylase|nr:bifunctional demethylmenaquinone methyltransferase/2-methoxy-6-polyprenyl-1,4-benzoquinol methylase UbiE [Tannerella sp.]